MQRYFGLFSIFDNTNITYIYIYIRNVLYKQLMTYYIILSIYVYYYIQKMHYVMYTYIYILHNIMSITKYMKELYM
jgi:hypothetical protein